jgi:hypothetical protein
MNISEINPHFNIKYQSFNQSTNVYYLQHSCFFSTDLKENLYLKFIRIWIIASLLTFHTHLCIFKPIKHVNYLINLLTYYDISHARTFTIDPYEQQIVRSGLFVACCKVKILDNI